MASPTPPKKLQQKTPLQGNSGFLESLISPRHLLEERMNPLVKVISCLAAHSSRESLCCAGEGADQTQHEAQAVEGDELLGIPALKNYSGVSAKERGSQLEFTGHICRSKRFNGCETDHSLSWLLNPHWRSAPTWLWIQRNCQVKQTCPQLCPKDNCRKLMRKWEHISHRQFGLNSQSFPSVIPHKYALFLIFHSREKRNSTNVFPVKHLIRILGFSIAHI